MPRRSPFKHHGFPHHSLAGSKSSQAFLNKAIERVRLQRPMTIVIEITPAYWCVIRETNRRCDPHFDSVQYID